MPRWSPGRYAVFDFAKNVQEVTAVAGFHEAVAENRHRFPLPVTRVDTQTWSVKASRLRVAARGVTLTYKVFADDLSGTFSQLDERHANFNGGSVFVYVAGHKQDAVTLKTINDFNRGIQTQDLALMRRAVSVTTRISGVSGVSTPLSAMNFFA